MSGILGIWNLDGQPVGPEMLERLAAPIAHRGPDGKGFWREGGVGVGHLMLRVTPESLQETQPVVDERAVVVFDGRLDDREELLAALPPSPRVKKDSPDPDLVLAAYLAFGEDFVKRLNGDFALAVYDRRERRLILARDAMGVRPLYYTQAGRTFLFASEIKALLAHPEVKAEPNDVTLAGFLMGPRRMPLGETFFQSIHSVRPSHMLVATPERVDADWYWDFDGRRRIRLASFDEYAEAFREHFERAVRRRLRSAFPVAISVSGGLDSSSIFCMAHALRQKHPSEIPEIVGMTYCPSDGSPADESQYVEALERHCGVSILRVPLELPHYWEYEAMLGEAWDVESPLLGGRPAEGYPVTQAMRRLGVRVQVTGHWGDQFLSDLEYLRDLFWRLRWLTVRRHLLECASWNTDVKPEYFWHQFFKELARTSLPAPMYRALKHAYYRVRRRPMHGHWYGRRLHSALVLLPPEAEPPDGLSWHGRSMYHEARWSYHVLCMELNEKTSSRFQTHCAFPFLDRDLVGFVMAVPGEAAMHGGVPKALLRRGMKGIVPEVVLGRRWKADFTHIGNAGLSQAESVRLRILGEESAAWRMGYRASPRAMPPPPPPGAADFNGRDLLALEIWLRACFPPSRAPGGVDPASRQALSGTGVLG